MHISKVRKIGSKGVTVEENSMVWVGCTNSAVYLVIEGNDAGMFGICGFVERVISCNPLVALVVLRKLGPKPKSPVLEVLVVPDY